MSDTADAIKFYKLRM